MDPSATDSAIHKLLELTRSLLSKKLAAVVGMGYSLFSLMGEETCITYQNQCK